MPGISINGVFYRSAAVFGRLLLGEFALFCGYRTNTDRAQSETPILAENLRLEGKVTIYRTEFRGVHPRTPIFRHHTCREILANFTPDHR